MKMRAQINYCTHLHIRRDSNNEFHLENRSKYSHKFNLLTENKTFLANRHNVLVACYCLWLTQSVSQIDIYEV